ncbi:MAG: molybdenum cofactor guanylyltransferase [Dehalococcoidia bacterium]
MTAIVLAGGKSLRLGRNKAIEQFGDKPLIQHVIDTVSQIDNDIIVVTAYRDQLPALAPSIKIVSDCCNPGSAALVGLYTGLKEASSFRSLVVACDMPYLNTDLLRYIISAAEGFDAAIPRIKNFIEPLHAVYSKNCLEPLRAQIESGDLKIFPLVKKVNVRFIEEDELNRFDPQHLSFLNVNYEHDLKKARDLMYKVRK